MVSKSKKREVCGNCSCSYEVFKGRKVVMKCVLTRKTVSPDMLACRYWEEEHGERK
uniref:Uncharacterized protein n=1 Tax=viral metagenome TaxID=1070528 RepID=A0A6M3K8V1_9ZZZZ